MHSSKYTEQEAELTFAFLTGEVSVFKIQRALGLDRLHTKARLLEVTRCLLDEQRLSLPRTDEELIPKARIIANLKGSYSIATMQRSLRISFAQASRIVDTLNEMMI